MQIDSIERDARGHRNLGDPRGLEDDQPHGHEQQATAENTHRIEQFIEDGCGDG